MSQLSLKKIEKLAKTIYENNFQLEEKLKTLTDECKLKVLSVLESKLISKIIRGDNKNKSELKNQLRLLFSKSDKIDLYATRTNIIKSYFFFFENKIEKAFEYLENVSEKDSSSLPFLLAKATLYFSQKKYKDALTHFLKAFVLFGKSFHLLRFMLGVCNFHLNDFLLAQKCFESYLDKTQKDDLFCLSMLAITYKRQANFEKYFQILEKSFHLSLEKGELDVNLMIELAEDYYINGNVEKSEKIVLVLMNLLDETSTEAVPESFPFTKKKKYFYNNEENKELLSELNYLLGRCYHHKMDSNNLETAHKLFLNSIKLNKSN
jgi:lipopolysaccharide biosynthesis regulator YciM